MTPRQRKQKRRLFVRRLFKRIDATWWDRCMREKRPMFGCICKQMTKKEADERWTGWYSV